MNIISISDLHGHLPSLPQCDVVCICGDIVPLSIQKNIIESIAWLAGPFQKWCLELPCEKVIFIAGNRDFVLQRLLQFGTNLDNEPKWIKNYDIHSIEASLFQNDSEFKIRFLNDTEYKYKDVVFYGTPWCPELRNWAFYADSDTLTEKFNQIPNCDVLLTHCPPKVGQQGIVLETTWNFGRDFGCEELKNAIECKDIKWVLSGHVHSGNHQVETFNGTKFRNVSIKNEDYEPTYQYFQFEV